LVRVFRRGGLERAWLCVCVSQTRARGRAFRATTNSSSASSCPPLPPPPPKKHYTHTHTAKAPPAGDQRLRFLANCSPAVCARLAMAWSTSKKRT
jgi:hypothetical protein